MNTDWSTHQPRGLGNMPWTDALPDDCTCRWVNYSDSTGWFRRGTDHDCPVHGEPEQAAS
jgi:hypothetical protein